MVVIVLACVQAGIHSIHKDRWHDNVAFRYGQTFLEDRAQVQLGGAGWGSGDVPCSNLAEREAVGEVHGQPLYLPALHHHHLDHHISAGFLQPGEVQQDQTYVPLWDSTVTYGPYNNIVVIHGENMSPMLVVYRLERFIEVSMWSDISTEEAIDVVHLGAALKGSFSR